MNRRCGRGRHVGRRVAARAGGQEQPNRASGGAPRQAARPSDADTGAVTAELAVGLIGVVLVLASVLSLASLGRQQLGVLDAAAAGARSAARGEPIAEVNRVTGRLAGPGSEVRVTGEGGLVTVVVSRPVKLALPGRPQVTVAGRATFPAEPQVIEP